MRFRKVYGQSKIDSCPFCNKQAVTKSSQHIPVCIEHKNSILNEFKCVCGEYLLLQTGKFGAYFRCIRCGNINFSKALEINDVIDVSKEQPKLIKQQDSTLKKQSQDKRTNGKEEIVMPGDPWYFS